MYELDDIKVKDKLFIDNINNVTDVNIKEMESFIPSQQAVIK